MTVSPREQLPTLRGRQTQAAIDAAARAVIARKGILATTISDIAAEAGRSTASFYNYYDSKEAMVREWAVRFRDEARERSRAAAEPGLTNWERSYEAAAAHWHTYRNRLAEIISVSQLAMTAGLLGWAIGEVICSYTNTCWPTSRARIRRWLTPFI